MDANDGFRELGRRECLRLMAKVPVGRIVFTRRALPAVLPVNFRLDDDGSVVLRTSAGSELVRAVDGTVVAFETDEVDPVAHSGWSVVVTGRATVVTGTAAHERLSRTGPRPWAPSPDGVFVRIEPELVTGRELVGGHSMYGLDLSS
ncbi:pyridoxamine 5'-phosphate oxidase family protein [Streptomyces cavernae]|uniref:pyridoxamine 5'-phosphate oxidase family protein n=1 Tax=Streptomyces cavernae TaxID=2259034 RepID=UPI000FEB60E5|nr:pyridoxamine 5'-phosphate oxidase family protein [Streptomyces cavernae]